MDSQVSADNNNLGGDINFSLRHAIRVGTIETISSLIKLGANLNLQDV